MLHLIGPILFWLVAFGELALMVVLLGPDEATPLTKGLRPRRTVIRLGGFYLQRWGGWGALANADTFDEHHYRRVVAFYPNAAWLTVLDGAGHSTDPS